MGYTIDSIKLADFCKTHGIAFLGVFGSRARGDMNPTSDIDLLVRYQEEKSLLDHVGISQELEQLFGQKVDLVTEQSVSPSLQSYVQKDLTPLYGQKSAHLS